MPQSTCDHCGSEYLRKSKAQRYCDAKCRERAKYQFKLNDGRYELDKARKRQQYTPRPPREPAPKSECSNPGCERWAQSRGMCKMHYKRWARANGYTACPSDKWNHKRRSNSHARRARMFGTHANKAALLSDIIERDGTDCAWCGQPVDTTLTYPHPQSKSVDHTVPLARGGAHTLENTRLMHLSCNLSKGTQVVASEDAQRGGRWG